MEFCVTGASHHRAPVKLREKFVSLPEPASRLYQQLRQSPLVTEAMVLSTCNRLEIITVSPSAEGRRAGLEALAAVSGLSPAALEPHLHCHQDLQAARYLFRVASSLDSLVLGEAQILGQVKDAFRQALAEKMVGDFLSRLLHRTFRAAKRVRSETTVAGGSISVASAAVALARQLAGGDLSGRRAVILGAGPMGRLAAAHLRVRELAELIIMNRSWEKARLVSAELGLSAWPWEQLPEALAEADLVIAATAAAQPIITADLLASALARRRGRRLIIIDIGVPRNVSDELRAEPALLLCNIDDLNTVLEDNWRARGQAAALAEDIIDEELDKLRHWLRAQSCQPLLAALGLKAEALRKMELEKTLHLHHFEPEQKAALEAMSSALVRRLLHDPLHFIRQIAEGGEDAGGPCGRPRETRCSSCQPEQCLELLRQAFQLF